MGTGIKGTPNEYDFGYDFNYELWTQETVLTLCNVPWNSDYRDIVKFTNKAALNTYLDDTGAISATISNMSYTKTNVPVRIATPFNKAYRYNYLRASNPVQPINGSDIQKDIYYFIQDVRYIAPNTTELVLQIDVWQTFGFDATFGSCYVERGHIGLANENQMDNFGRDYLTVPEGLDTGGEYRISARRKIKVAGLDANDARYDALICSTIDLTSNFGTAAAPEMSTAKGGSVGGLTSGATFYVLPGKPEADEQNLFGFMLLLKDFPWISQGIVSITLIPPVTRYYPDFTYGKVSGANPLGLKVMPGTPLIPKKYSTFTNWRNDSELTGDIPARYRSLKKFFTFPYMCIELTTWNGQPIVIKPESWADPHAGILERASFMPPGQRITFHPLRYNGVDGTKNDDLYPDYKAAGLPGYLGEDGDDSGEYLDLFTQISSFPNVPMVNNNAALYMAQNANGLAFQNDSAQWAQQRALAGNTASYDNASTAMKLANDLTSIGRTQDAASTALGNNLMGAQATLDALSGIGMGAGMGALGGPAGAAIGGIGGAANGLVNGARVGMNQQANVQQNAVRSAAALGGNAASQRASADIRDTNKGLADWAARGDYQNSIAAINARVQDSRLAQPSVSGQFGGEAYNFANNTVELNIRWKLVDVATIKRIGEFWLRYGYSVQQFITIPSSLQVMSKFTYWKMQETYIIGGSMPEQFKQTIRGIFEKGVTVWKTPNDIGRVDMATNVPLSGVSY